MFTKFACIILMLAGCPGWDVSEIIAPPVLISAPGFSRLNVPAFLMQSIHPDGNPVTPLLASSPMTYRRADMGNPNPPGYWQLSDSFMADDGSVWGATWAYEPWHHRNPHNGDGGEVYTFDGETVRIAATMDGSRPGTIMHFVGPRCGGSGWVAFKTDANFGEWRGVAGGLAISYDQPYACPPLGTGFTRYRLENLALPFVFGGVMSYVTLPTVISEHFNNASVEESTEMERTFFVYGWGRLIWEPWSKSQTPAANLNERCPPTPWPGPEPDWQRYECRFNSKIVPTDGELSPASYGWPPAGFAQ